MDKKILFTLLSVNFIFIGLIVFILNNDQNNSELSDDLTRINSSISELNGKINKLTEALDESNDNVSFNPILSSDEQLTVMSYTNVVNALKEVLKKNQLKSSMSKASEPENIELSTEQRINLEQLEQQLDGYNTMSFHDLLSNMDQQKLPEQYKNKLLSKMVQKLNNNELSPDSVLGIIP